MVFTAEVGVLELRGEIEGVAQPSIFASWHTPCARDTGYCERDEVITLRPNVCSRI